MAADVLTYNRGSAAVLPAVMPHGITLAQDDLD